MGKYKDPHYKRDWERRKKAAHPEHNTLAGGRKSRAKKPPRAPGECTACGKVFPLTADHFVWLRVKRKGKPDWEGWSAECRDCRNARFRQFYDDNAEEQIARVTKYLEENPHKKRAQNMLRYASITNSCPPWADHQMIETIYALADFMTDYFGVPYEVDHYYPLRGKLCSGLHAPGNLRIITREANQAKGNRMPGA